MTTTALTNGPAADRPSPRDGVRPRVNAKAIGLVAAALVVVGVIAAVVLPPFLEPADPAMADAHAVAPRPAPIDGDRAYGYLKQICAIGPRPAGSAANAKQRNFVAGHFKSLGATVREQPFTGRDPISRRKVDMVNLIGSWAPERTERVVIAAHYDTRPFPDQDPDPELRRTPFVGANDGASGVALMMEMAHHLKELETPFGVDLVLFDGEELVYDREGEYFLGSKAFSRAYRASRRGAKAGTPRYVAGILLDMVGGRDLDLKREPFSAKLAPQLLDEVWSVAARLGARAFRDDFGREVLDDHLPMNDANIPTIDIIDFDYPQWHTAADLPEQCSGESLAQVGRVVTAWLSQARKPAARRR